MSAKIGRNDPCHCGSGKKYKHCHLRQDEEEAKARRPHVVPDAPNKSPEPILPSIGAMAQAALGRSISTEKRAALEKVSEWAKRRDEIYAAQRELEAHHHEWEALTQTEAAILERAGQLFGSDEFASLRFTLPEVDRVLKKIGQVDRPDGTGDPKKLKKALKLLVNDDRRTHLCVELMLRVPDLVKEKRYVDAMLVEDCAAHLAEDEEEPNLFLVTSFYFAYQELRQRALARDTEKLKNVGIDVERLMNLKPSELDSWIKEQLDDPAKAARFDEMLAASPERSEEAMRTMNEAGQTFQALLGEDIAVELLLQEDELETLANFINERHRETVLNRPKPLKQTELTKLGVAWMGEVAAKIFTPPRIQRLLTDLGKVRDELWAEEKKPESLAVQLAIDSLNKETDPANNPYLISICAASLRALDEDPDEPEEISDDSVD